MSATATVDAAAVRHLLESGTADSNWGRERGERGNHVLAGRGNLIFLAKLNMQEFCRSTT